jgi:UDP-N-acetylglucosamine 1-carboxyvinyltransferase
MTTLLAYANGVSEVEETIYENRFKNIEYLNQMGANIGIYGQKIRIFGKTKLTGTNVVATDLRAGACLVLAGLIADGKTIIDDAEHVLRGYENIVEKLTNVGAKIEIKED